MPDDAADGALADRLARAITLAGPVSVARYMEAANSYYYASRDPLGTAGDFTTSPEISQMFGELIGLWCADLWDRADRPNVAWVELGPGRGTLAVDARRSMHRAGFEPHLHLVETSPVLRAMQRQRLADARWHDAVETLPTDQPLIFVANEFFDALPICQLIRGADGWHERLVACQDTLFLPVVGNSVPPEIVPGHLRDALPGSIIETSPAQIALIRQLTDRIVAQGGVLLAIDYGYAGPAVGDTLQAVRGHGFANPFEAPGEQDLTAHVDMTTLAAAATARNGMVYGPVAQRDLLGALGIDLRTAVLAKTAPERVESFMADRARLMDSMGTLFQALAVTAPGWPIPAGFS